jgi:hypothetical protein
LVLLDVLLPELQLEAGMSAHAQPYDFGEARAAVTQCECGCGGTAPIARQTDRRKGWTKGQPVRFIQGHGGRGKPAHNRSAPDVYLVDENGCWIWQLQRSPNGYGRTQRNGKVTTAHRASYERLVGPIPEGLHLDHLCRVRLCVNPAHLEPVTPLENNRRSRTTKLTAEIVAQIRGSGEGGKVLAERYGVSPQTICNIRKGRTWTEVQAA